MTPHRPLVPPRIPPAPPAANRRTGTPGCLVRSKGASSGLRLRRIMRSPDVRCEASACRAGHADASHDESSRVTEFAEQVRATRGPPVRTYSASRWSAPRALATFGRNGHPNRHPCCRRATEDKPSQTQRAEHPATVARDPLRNAWDSAGGTAAPGPTIRESGSNPAKLRPVAPGQRFGLGWRECAGQQGGRECVAQLSGRPADFTVHRDFFVECVEDVGVLAQILWWPRLCAMLIACAPC